ncbi:MAG: hypothetical protein CM1200mP8_4980 [Chloroflexota bacterium]|nr:MAG: hypothetical protein CM1200mP8_4980 [Chloroflexota bacterium]
MVHFVSMLTVKIYNHLELRQELESRGHIYQTNSDSEAVLHGYEEWGLDLLGKLKGMYAFSIYDSNQGVGGKGRLILARDKLGIKPLYYSITPEGITYASEIKAILKFSDISREPDMIAVSQYLTMSATPAPRTMFAGINKLPPGHMAIADLNGEIEIREYWSVLDNRIDLSEASEEEIVEQISESLTSSIRRRLMTDVPFGVFFSGGVDSSLNLAFKESNG